MGISWKTRFFLLREFISCYWQLETKLLEEVENVDTGYVMDRFSAFIEDVRRGKLDSIIIQTGRLGDYTIPVTQDRQIVYEAVKNVLFSK
jgi:hypothetical protein